MSDQRHHEPWLEEEDEPPPRPWYKTWRGAAFATAIIVLLLFIFSHGRNVAPQDTQKPAPIAVTSAYSPVVPDAKAAPEPAPAPPTNLLPAPPPPAPVFRPPQPNGANGTAQSAPAMVSYDVPAPPPPPAPAAPGEPAHTGIKFATATIPGSKASPAIDSTYILMPGLLLCVLDTAIDSNLPGPLQAHLPGPVYSRKGTVLMEAETTIWGTYKSMTPNGSNRLEAVSTFAVTPHDIWVPLSDMPFGDDLGRTGLPGEYNPRYLERFAGAVLLDLGQAGLSIAQAEVAKGGNTYLSFNSSESLASQILRSEINKPPLFTKHAGEWIALWITHPINFNDSYVIK